MPALSTHLTFISDPGHGWLRVPLAEIAALGIEEKISPYSFIKGNDAYLEEDCDYPCYLAARTAQGYPAPEIIEQYVNHFERPSLRFQARSLNRAFWDKLRR